MAEKVNVAESHPEQVELLKALLIKQIKEGRTTQGEILENDEITIDWPQANFAFK
ncbi:hypothetical protein [Algibacter sp. L3A6]|uniref:hypothetical protein n=1 Tax=Algibacter sp. L3A6 TaxID=2686366 RepID=UPI0018EEFFCF|nr:hypothetical protein [Algibacter sp. L3A6]